VSRIEPSHFDSATFYVTFDNHRNGDFTPYVYVSNDFGKTFRSIVNNLPKGGIDFVHVIREDVVNPNLLFVGSDVGVFVSTDRGESWQKFMTDFPTVPVHDLKIHPRDHELIAGTHGRSIWIVDIAPLEELNSDVLASQLHLFKLRTAYRFNERPDDNMGQGAGAGHMRFMSNSPPVGAEIVYRVAPGTPIGRAQIVIQDPAGDTVQTISASGSPGLQRVYWNFTMKRPPRALLSPAGKRDSAQLAAKLDKVIDSLVAGGAERSTYDSARSQILSGSFGGFGGGGGGGGGPTTPGIPRFQPRPGESAAVAQSATGNRPAAAAAAGTGGGGAGGGEGPAGTPIGQIAQGLGGFQALQQLGLGQGGPPPQAAAGDYSVSVTVGGKTVKQKLRVVTMRPSGGLGEPNW
jgi:hypothetical protein